MQASIDASSTPAFTNHELLLQLELRVLGRLLANFCLIAAYLDVGKVN